MAGMLKNSLRKAKHTIFLIGSLVRDSVYDARRMVRYSHGAIDPISQKQSQYRIRKAYHGIEKGLSLPRPRHRFGLPKVQGLVAMVNAHIAKYGLDSTAMAAGSAIAAYDKANDTDFAEQLHDEHKSQELDFGGTDTVSSAEFSDAVSFLKSRRSIRQFSGADVPQSMIEQAAKIAQNAPSVCNRQAGKVYAFDKAEVLSLQPGNAGFGDTAAWGLVVTSDLKAFSTSGERHQAWCDGGMFAMALLYGLHALNLGACPLAWTASPRRDKEVRRRLGIPDNEVIVMFIAVGALGKNYRVAKSFRKDAEDALVFGKW